MRDVYCCNCQKWFEPDQEKLFFFRSDWKTNVICMATKCINCEKIVLLKGSHKSD